MQVSHLHPKQQRLVAHDMLIDTDHPHVVEAGRVVSISSRRPSARTALFAVFHDTASASAIRATLRCATTSPSNAQPSARRDSFERGSAAAVVSWRQTCPQPMQRYRRSVISSTVGRHPNGS
jgi:hypothetical protein